MTLVPGAIYEVLAARFGDAVFGFVPAVPREVKDAQDQVRDAYFHVHPEALFDVAATLRDEPALACDFLQNLTAVDWPKRNAIDVVYHLHSYRHRHEIVVKTSLPRERPRVATVSPLWKNAEWLEREQYDLFGVIFEGHPDLRRLLLPDDWVGHPMRKDYREAAEYRGMPTTRPSPLDMLQAYDKHAGKAGAQPSNKPSEPPS